MYLKRTNAWPHSPVSSTALTVVHLSIWRYPWSLHWWESARSRQSISQSVPASPVEISENVLSFEEDHCPDQRCNNLYQHQFDDRKSSPWAEWSRRDSRCSWSTDLWPRDSTCACHRVREATANDRWQYGEREMSYSSVVPTERYADDCREREEDSGWFEWSTSSSDTSVVWIRTDGRLDGWIADERRSTTRDSEPVPDEFPPVTRDRRSFDEEETPRIDVLAMNWSMEWEDRRSSISCHRRWSFQATTTIASVKWCTLGSSLLTTVRTDARNTVE